MGRVQQKIVVMDLEGVLVPEIWIAFAEKTGIEELRLTTRDIQDYDVLMKGRLKILEQHKLGLKEIQEAIATLKPLPGALEFLNQLRSKTQVVILSDTFEQFAAPLMKQLNWPTLLCHRLVVDEESGKIIDYKLRQEDQKRQAVKAFQSLNYKVIAFGDSFNDTGMLSQADRAFFFHAPLNVQEKFPEFPPFDDYDKLMEELDRHLA